MSERVEKAEGGGDFFLEFPGLAGNFLIVFSHSPPKVLVLIRMIYRSSLL